MPSTQLRQGSYSSPEESHAPPLPRPTCYPVAASGEGTPALSSWIKGRRSVGRQSSSPPSTHEHANQLRGIGQHLWRPRLCRKPLYRDRLWPRPKSPPQLPSRDTTEDWQTTTAPNWPRRAPKAASSRSKRRRCAVAVQSRDFRL